MAVPALIAAVASEVIRRGDHRPEIAAVQMTMSTSFNTFKKAIKEPVRVKAPTIVPKTNHNDFGGKEPSNWSQ